MGFELSPRATLQLLEGQRDVLALLAQGAPLRESLNRIAHYAETCAPDMQASILWYEASTGKLRRGGHGRLPDTFADAVDGRMPGPAAGGGGGAAASRRARVVRFDVQVDSAWEAFRPLAAEHNIRSAWSTPLLSPSDGSLLGVFEMYYPDTREPSEEDLALVEHFTHLAAIAIERNRRDEALREGERRRHEGLLALTASMAHEMNTPLGVARTASELLAEELSPAGGRNPELIAETLGLVQENLERGIALLRSFRSSVLDQALHEAVQIDVAALVEATVRSLTPVFREKHLDVKVQVAPGPLPFIRGAPVRLQQVVTNLLVNVATHAYGKEGGPVEISVGPAALRDGHVEIVLLDRGQGMTPAVAARCMDPFYTTARARGGSGLGLFVSRHVTEAELGGSLLLETQPGQGVRWTILLPGTRAA